MIRPSKRLATALAAATFTALSVITASASEPVATPATETLFISAGCAEDTPGTCTSTRWLGKETGDATTNFLTATTPVDEVLFRADGSVNWRDYGSDRSLRAGGYPLRTDEPITMAVRLVADGVMGNTTVHARITGRYLDSAGKSKTVNLAEQQQVITVVADEQTVSFDFPVPAALAGLSLTSLVAEVAVHGVNVEGGRIDQQGGSTVTIPYLAPAAS